MEIVSSHCSESIEFLMLKCRPFYLPREFTAISITAGHIAPSANKNYALSTLYQSISMMQNTTTQTVSISSLETLTRPT